MSVCGLGGNKGSLLHTPSKAPAKVSTSWPSHPDVLLTLIAIFSKRLR